MPVMVARGIAFAMVFGAGVVCAADSVEVKELKMALAASQKEAKKLKGAVVDLEKKGAQMGAALAAANAEAAQYRESYQELRTRMEALGVSVLDRSDSALQSKLVAALNERGQVEQLNRDLVEHMLVLSEAVMSYMKTAVNPNVEARVAVEKAIRESNEKMGFVTSPRDRRTDGELSQARVISVPAEPPIIVLNVGSKAGVHVGMPFELMRKDRPIGKALVVDVRENICGAILESSISKEDSVKVGDIAKVDASKTL